MWRNKIFKVECPELPVVRKCCCFIPVRRGVIIFGYINLTVSLLAFPLLIFLLVAQFSGEDEDAAAPAVVREPARLPLTTLWVTIDVAMSLVLLVAAHKKNRTLLKVYLYLGAVFEIITLFLDLVFFEYGDYLENLVYFFFLGLNIYLLYLVYSVIYLLKESSEVQYVAHRDPA